jgi:hypothetical protein
MRARRLAPVLAAAALSGCGGGEPGAGVAGVETVRDSARAADAFATTEELAWIRRFSDWAFRFAGQGGKVRAYESGPGFEKATAGDEVELRRYRGLLEPFRTCEDGFLEQVGRAPTQRLQPAERNLVEACRRYRTGIELVLEAIDGDDPGLAQRARYKIEDGNLKLSVAAGLLPPGEKQKLPVARGATGKSRIDPRYGEIASAVAEKEIEARCWSQKDWTRLLVEEEALTRGQITETMMAFASAGGQRINLGPFVCRHLDALVYDGKRPREPLRQLDLAQALGALVHESRHAAGVADEPTAECEAIQLMPEAARATRIEPAYARELLRVAWQSYPTLPADYRSAECRDGGKLDLSPGDGRFP